MPVLLIEIVAELTAALDEVTAEYALAGEDIQQLSAMIEIRNSEIDRLHKKLMATNELLHKALKALAKRSPAQAKALETEAMQGAV